MADDLITPEQISQGRVVRDEDLPALAVQWLVVGYDSPLLRELAGLTRREATQARELLPKVVAELGHPITANDCPSFRARPRSKSGQIGCARCFPPPTPARISFGRCGNASCIGAPDSSLSCTFRR